MVRGDLFAGRFELERVAGTGGMGAVWKARDLRTDQPVALKVIWSLLAPQIARFQREARVLEELEHPGIARHVEHGVTDEGRHYLAMEWLEGEDLAARLLRGPLEIEECVALAIRVAEALAVVHARGIVHRDLKPANLFLPGGRLDGMKIVDFGLARSVAATHGLTEPGIVVGTPAYMPPEQARGELEIDARVDIYALGCVLFECLCGRPPFLADHPLAMLGKVLFEDVPHPRDLRAETPPALDELVVRLCAKDPSGRPPSAPMMACELRALKPAEGDAQGPLTPRRALTTSERRFIAVILAVSAKRGLSGGHQSIHAQSTGEHLATDRTVTDPAATAYLVQPSFPLTILHPIVARHGARVEVLRDGSAAAVLTGAASPTDLATSAARCALALRAALPGAQTALAIGWDVIHGAQPVGAVFDRAGALLAAHAQASSSSSPTLSIDAMAVSLLRDRFEISEGAHGSVLIQEREPTEEVSQLLGKPTTCVGRERELRLLQDLFEECAGEKVSRPVLVTASAGVGKSRLRHELVRRLRARGAAAEVWFAGGDPMRVGAPFGLLSQLVRRAAGLSSSEPVGIQRRKLRELVARGVDPTLQERVTTLLSEMVGTPFDDTTSTGSQLRQAWIDLLNAETRSQPLLLVLEDLHWGDQPTIDAVDIALRILRDRPLMVLALARPEVRQSFPDLWGERGVTELRLAELSPAASAKLVQQVLGSALTSEAIAGLVARGGGNAFVLEELVRAEADGRGSDAPATALAMVQARLDGLDPDARRVLRAGSIFGEDFSRDGLECLLGGTPPSPLLDTLERLEWIAPRRDPTTQADLHYTFRHSLVRDAAYAMLTDDDRALGHRLAAAWLSASGAPEALSLAVHFERGGDLKGASQWYTRATEQALRASDLEAVIARAERGVDCGAAGEALGQLRLFQAEAHFQRGESADARIRAGEAMGALPRGGAAWLTASALLAGAHEKLGDTEQLADLARELLDHAMSEPEPYLIAASTTSINLFAAGQKELAIRLLAAADEASRRASTLAPRARGWLSRAHAVREAEAGYLARGLEMDTQAAAAFEEAGDEVSARRATRGMANAYMLMGMYAEAEAIERKTIDLMRRKGFHRTAAGALSNLGMLRARQGFLAEARAIEEEAIEAFRVQGNRRQESSAHGYLAIILCLSGELDAAAAAATRSVAHSVPGSPHRAQALAILARVLLLQGNTHEALVHARGAMALLDALGSMEEGEFLTRLVHAEALYHADELEAARAAILSARDRVHARAAMIGNLAWRRSFLADPDNARTLALARDWLDHDVA